MEFEMINVKWANDVCRFLHNETEINFGEFLENNQGKHFLVQDDYVYWNSKGRTRGKYIVPLPGIQQMGFDDNDCMFTKDFETNVTIHKVNTMNAALDSNYFVNKFWE